MTTTRQDFLLDTRHAAQEMSREQIGIAYMHVVGYNIVEDDPTIRTDHARDILVTVIEEELLAAITL